MARLQKKKTVNTKFKKRVKKTDAVAQNTDGGNLAHSGGLLGKRGATKSAKPFTTTKSPVAGGKLNWWQKSIQFLREVKVELKKVTWPSRKQTIGSTIVVLVLVILISLFLGMVDMGLTSFVRMVLQ